MTRSIARTSSFTTPSPVPSSENQTRQEDQSLRFVTNYFKSSKPPVPMSPTRIMSSGKRRGYNNYLRKTIASSTKTRAFNDTRTTAQRYARMSLCMPLIAGASLRHGLPGLRKKNDGEMCSYNLIRRTTRTYLEEDVEPDTGLRTDVSSPEGSDQPASRPWRSAPTSPPGGVFRRKTKPATRQGRLASLSIHGPDREVSKSLRWTDLRGLQIKLGRTTRAASSRPRPNGKRRLTLEHDRVGTGSMADRG